MLLLLAACARVVPPAPRIAVSAAVSPAESQGLSVTADGGRLTSVLVYAGRDPVPGSFDASRTRWRSSGSLRPGTDYVVDAIATGRDGVTAHTATTLHTAPVRG
ncbi:hypothetical protein Pth03_68420 [Planotetraspora thailandica]|uniref:Bacterial Ig domain-containing protein n=2 Tax=Planotetraspora thailandica TaxID=487172 RepID=A0A8J4DDB3_9ACTN|nr:hypothetical protein Pth03_68420 [Planotetraspora thailandica]